MPSFCATDILETGKAAGQVTYTLHLKSYRVGQPWLEQDVPGRGTADSKVPMQKIT